MSWPDLLMATGRYQHQPDLPFSPGGEAAGRVRVAPPGADLRVGQRVVAVMQGGAWREVVSVPVERVCALPEGISLRTGAGLPFNLLAVHFGLVRRARLERGETVLVHGAAGGIGSMSLRLARVLGARTIAVVSSPAKARAATEAGADHVVSSRDFLAETRDLIGGRGVDLVVDPVGGDRIVADSIRILAPEGRLLVLGFASGEIPSVRLNRILFGNVSIVGAGWGAFRQLDPGYLGQQWAQLFEMLDRGQLVPPEPVAYQVEEFAHVLSLMGNRELVGKAVLTFR